MDECFKAISALVRKMHQLAHQAELQYTREVDAIIREHSRDADHIEHTLDGMLSFCFDPALLSLYKRLCRYYFRIDQAATAFYVNEYRQMWDVDKTPQPAPPRKPSGRRKKMQRSQ